MKIKEQTRQLAAGCFEVVDLTWFEEIFEEYKLQDE
ncbi:chlorohydrolase [Streptococcus pneumoniae]|nr:chlorohydrolase [Streptococcus pneumoniae]